MLLLFANNRIVLATVISVLPTSTAVFAIKDRIQIQGEYLALKKIVFCIETFLLASHTIANFIEL